MRFLFCLPTTALSGGIKVVLELARHLQSAGHTAHLFSYARAPRWFGREVALIPQQDIADIPSVNYDFILACNAFLMPALLPHVGTARPIFFCQDYESFHHGHPATYEAFVYDLASFTALYRLEVPIIATSQAVRRLIQTRIGRDCFWMPVSIDRSLFRPRVVPRNTARKRVLFVGNYLMPYKGMAQGMAALRLLSARIPLQLVLVTQEVRRREMFANLPFPVEIHTRPREVDMPAIYASCDLYCCSSWYEGFGLPALEAFACGIPVVSARTHGVSDYGVDEVNLLLGQPNDAADLAEKIGAVLSDPTLAARLRAGGLETAAGWPDWHASTRHFLNAITAIDAGYNGPGAVDANVMQALLDALECEGNLTPIAVFREFEELATQLDRVCDVLIQEGARAQTIEQLRSLGQAFGARLANPRVEYYDAFRAKYDLCRLLVACAGSERISDYVACIKRRGADELPTSTAFSEIRYPDA